MHYSGILVRAVPGQLSECARQIDSCAGAEVYVRSEDASSLVAVLETETVGEQEDTFRQIRDLPQVLATDLLYHYVDENADAAAGAEA